jgi:predicted DNA binding CopG/RHH family protein
MKYPYKLDKEERQILHDIESGKFVSVPNVKAEIERVRAIARAQLKTKNINLRLSENDIKALKEKAAENSLPYQTLVATLIRQYLSGKFNIIL